MGSALVALVMAVGLLGVLVPLLPGTALGILAELTAGLLIVGTWMVGVLVT